jgi:hypothetical protein
MQNWPACDFQFCCDDLTCPKASEERTTNPTTIEGAIMAISSSTQNLSASGQRVVAFFRKTDDAYRAVSELKDAGFTSEEIGVISRSDHHTAGASARTGSATKDESFWDKLTNFF